MKRIWRYLDSPYVGLGVGIAYIATSLIEISRARKRSRAWDEAVKEVQTDGESERPRA